MTLRYEGKKVLVTCVERYMGNVIADGFEQEGAEVVRDSDLLVSESALEDLADRAKDIDILVANFAEDPMPNRVDDILDEELDTLFQHMVFPLIRTVRRFVPAMKAKGKGKIIAMTSASPLRGIPKFSAYCSARGAQNAFVRAAGLELAADNIQFNAIAQHYVKNERYFPDELIESERFKARVLPQIPTGKIAEAEETAELALYLASDKCTHMVGQVIPWSGGWATTTG
ncbi:SDR family oxidoreductase [Pseudomaricurvus alkylphenolicus]|uniref:SDR family oxidoreductase n=1 Tax=Pseudomaricurvus alkylphenolicus TaxID=1306991 RepID=UPI00141F571C|nr:SDR family oxidoreductase [Pseudomaricurvus alkylphenolicus]NIB43361.1 SDR family oxidoreductase [Pseudomaricurvus alkylphenolicus]